MSHEHNLCLFLFRTKPNLNSQWNFLNSSKCMLLSNLRSYFIPCIYSVALLRWNDSPICPIQKIVLLKINYTREVEDFFLHKPHWLVPQVSSSVYNAARFENMLVSKPGLGKRASSSGCKPQQGLTRKSNHRFNQKSCFFWTLLGAGEAAAPKWTPRVSHAQRNVPELWIVLFHVKF